jgi:hypothetical protein
VRSDGAIAATVAASLSFRHDFAIDYVSRGDQQRQRKEVSEEHAPNDG